jgi:hypothetical protein
MKMTELVEWFLIFFMFYTFFAVWVISNTLEEIINILKNNKNR